MLQRNPGVRAAIHGRNAPRGRLPLYRVNEYQARPEEAMEVKLPAAQLPPLRRLRPCRQQVPSAVEELIIGGGRGGEKDFCEQRSFGSALASDTRTDLSWRAK